MIQHYELMYVVPGSIEMEHVPAVKAIVADILKNAGAVTTVELDMERRRLAYKMGQETYGYYHVVQFDMEASDIKALDTKLRLENQVLRFLLIKAKPVSLERLKEIVAGEKYKRQRPVTAATAVAAVAPVKVEQTSATALTEAEMQFAKSVSSKHVEEVVEEDKKLSIEDLDKKLDAILEDTDLDKKL